MDIRNQLYIAPLYNIGFFREKPYVHSIMVFFFDVLFASMVYGVGLVIGWGMVAQFRIPSEDWVGAILILFAYPFIGIPTLILVVILFYLLVVNCGKWWMSLSLLRSQHSPYEVIV